MSHSNPQNYDNFVVAFYDVLNQGNTMKQWDDREKLENNDAGSHEAYKKSVDIVKNVRLNFKLMRDGFDNWNDDKIYRMLDGKSLDSIKINRNPMIHHQAFSDTNIWFVRADDDNRTICILQILRIFAGVSFLHLKALYEHVPARGAIDFGCGTDSLGIQDDQSSEIYGPVLEKAYKQESKCAQYPRILVGKTLFQYLQEQKEKWESKWENNKRNQFSSVMKMLTENAVELVAKDNDGLYILDYAGEKSANQQRFAMDKQGVDSSALYVGTLQFALEEKEKFLSEGDCKLTGRYTMLVEYLESRKQYWQ